VPAGTEGRELTIQILAFGYGPLEFTLIDELPNTRFLRLRGLCIVAADK
jgi:hypothetical protein